jgi:hypothetical protein
MSNANVDVDKFTIAGHHSMQVIKDRSMYHENLDRNKDK